MIALAPNLLSQFPVFRITLPNGHVLVSRFLSTLVKTLKNRGVPVNRTSVHHAMKGPHGNYKRMRIERTTLASLGPLEGAEVV